MSSELYGKHMFGFIKQNKQMKQNNRNKNNPAKLPSIVGPLSFPPVIKKSTCCAMSCQCLALVWAILAGTQCLALIEFPWWHATSSISPCTTGLQSKFSGEIYFFKLVFEFHSLFSFRVLGVLSIFRIIIFDRSQWHYHPKVDDISKYTSIHIPTHGGEVYYFLTLHLI